MLNPKARVAALLILGAVFVTIGCDPARSLTDQQHVQKAKEYQDEGKLESAVIELKNALQKNPNNSEARHRLGEVYVSLGLGAEAEKELGRARELGVDEEALKVATGEALLMQGLFPRVLEEVQIGDSPSPAEVAKIIEIRGRAHLGLRQIADACKSFAESREKDAQYVPSYWGLAHCAAARGKLEGARAELDKALKLDDKNSGTWALLGDLERVSQRAAEAEAAYTNALNYRSTNLEALSGRALVRIDRNDLEGASQDIDAIFKVAKNHPIAVQLRGVIQFKQGKYAEAKTSFERVLNVIPEYLPGILWLGLSNFALGNFEQAAKEFDRYLRAAPNDTRIRALLALSQTRVGRAKEAAETLKALRDVNVDDPQNLALLAQAHMFVGQTDLAATYMQKAVEKKPDEAALRVGLAAALSQKGARAEAIEELEDAIQLDAEMMTADVLLIQNLIQDKQLDKALAAAEALEKKQPDKPTALNLKGAIYLLKSDLANARKSFERALGLEAASTATAINLAQLDLLEGKPEAAQQRFQTVLARDKTNVRAMLGLAGVARATGKETEYVDWLEKAVKAGPKNVRPRLLLASHYLQKNEVRKALALAREAQSVSQDNIQVLDVLGSAQLAAGERDNAVVTFTKLANLAPKNPGAHYRLATAHAAKQDLSATRVALDKALALRPDYLDAEILLASVELGAGRPAEALKIAQRIQKQHPESPSGYTLQGDALMAQKQHGPALKAYEQALGMQKSALLAVRVHQALSAVGNRQEADDRLIKWLEDQPGDVIARTYLASSYAQAGQNKRAIEQYQLIVEADPKNIQALNDLAWLYQQQKDPRALATAEKAYELRPDAPQIMDTLGWILVEQGDTARSAELLRKAAEMAPTSPAIHYHWTVALAKSGDKARARKELEALLARHKQFREREAAEELLKQL